MKSEVYPSTYGSIPKIKFFRDHSWEVYMLRDSWNFHGDIAVPLESYASSFFHDIGRPFTKIYDADCIESQYFVEVMILLLRAKTNYEQEHSNIDIFINKCKPFFGLSGHDIPKEKAAELFNSFISLYDE